MTTVLSRVNSYDTRIIKSFEIWRTIDPHGTQLSIIIFSVENKTQKTLTVMCVNVKYNKIIFWVLLFRRDLKFIILGISISITSIPTMAVANGCEERRLKKFYNYCSVRISVQFV